MARHPTSPTGRVGAPTRGWDAPHAPERNSGYTAVRGGVPLIWIALGVRALRQGAPDPTRRSRQRTPERGNDCGDIDS